MRQNRTYKELTAYTAQLEKRIRELEDLVEDNYKKNEILKVKFLSNISHELRTPMNAILGFSSLLNDQQLTFEKREEYMDHINQSSAKLLHVVEAMIDVSLLETGQLQIRHDECVINQLLTDIYHYFNIDRHRRNQNSIALLLSLEVKKDDFKIITDQYRLHQVITNLLSNAFNYTEKGIIEFGYHKDHKGDQITFFVSDSGKGILKEKSEQIFQSSEKQSNRDTFVDSGIGLVLTLSKGIITLLGGKMWVEENVFHGSTFKFTLPDKPLREMGSQLNPFTSKFIA